MRFIVDECTGPRVSGWLRSHGHEVFCVYGDARGLTDIDILDKAHRERWVLITNDRDFGERVYREHLPHSGVVFLRLPDERASAKIRAIRRLLDAHAMQLTDRFVVVTDRQVRFGSP